MSFASDELLPPCKIVELKASFSAGLTCILFFIVAFLEQRLCVDFSLETIGLSLVEFKKE